MSEAIFAQRLLRRFAPRNDIVVFFTVISLFGSTTPSPANTGPASDSVITIQSVQLKNESGEWLIIIEPDRQVDLLTEEPGLSFFNNNGRVPAGSYVNFKLVVIEGLTNARIEIYGKGDFTEPLSVKKGSFIGVWFRYLLPGKQIQEVTVTIDGTTKVFPQELIILAR